MVHLYRSLSHVARLSSIEEPQKEKKVHVRHSMFVCPVGDICTYPLRVVSHSHQGGHIPQRQGKKTGGDFFGAAYVAKLSRCGGPSHTRNKKTARKLKTARGMGGGRSRARHKKKAPKNDPRTAATVSHLLGNILIPPGPELWLGNWG